MNQNQNNSVEQENPSAVPSGLAVKENKDSGEGGKEHRAAPSAEMKPTPELKAVPMQKILVCDLAGNGFYILWTLDGQTWINSTRARPYNAAELDRWLERYEREQPQAEVRHVVDFYSRIPADWCIPGARVI